MSLPFECDVCHFRNINKRDVDWESEKDLRTLVYIRGASLDAMWSRTKGSVTSNVRRMRKDMLEASKSLSFGQILPAFGNPEMEDKVGMGIAIITLHTSLRKGRNAETIQFDTMRKTGTWYAHAYEAITGQELDSLYAADNRKMFGTKCVTRSRWFGAFLLGAKRRMGVIRFQDEALTVGQLLGALDLLEEEWQSLGDEDVRIKRVEELGAFMCIGFCASLRGEEVPLTDIRGVVQYWKATQKVEPSHVMITLQGRFKGEDNLRWHLSPIADETRSGIPTRRWVSRLMRRRTNIEKCTSGPLFADPSGRKASIRMYDDDFREVLSKLLSSTPSLFPAGVEIGDYSLRRSLRRGSTTEAQNNKVPSTTIDLINRWRRREAAKGAEPGLPMRQVYTHASSALVGFLAYSQSL